MNPAISPITSHETTIISYDLDFVLGHISAKFLGPSFKKVVNRPKNIILIFQHRNELIL